MRIGLAFDVKRSAAPNSPPTAGEPDDLEEEFDSPSTISALAEALMSFGHDVDLLGDGEPFLRRLLDGPRLDLVFNVAEGQGVGRSREARVPGCLEMLGLPYTGSDPLTLAIALDKDCAKRVVASAGVLTPRGVLIAPDDDSALESACADLRFPVLVKPAFEGSSKGIRQASLLHDAAELSAWAAKVLRDYRQPVLVEEFIDGAELTVGVLGGADPEILGIMEIVPLQTGRPFVYSVEVKRDWTARVRYDCPASLNSRVTAAVDRAAAACWKVLGCRDLARFDFRLRDDEPVFIEANPLPGLTPGVSDLVILAEKVGVGYVELIGRIVSSACRRHGLGDGPR